MRARLQQSGTPVLRDIAFFLRQKKWLFIAFAIGFALYLAPTPEGLSREGHIVLVISMVAVVLFVTEPVPLPSVALMIIVAQIMLMGLDSSEVARSLMSDSVLFIMGSLMLAVAVVKQQLDKRIAYMIVRVTGTGVFGICVGISFVCGVLASIIGEHTVAAMMLPVAVTLVTLTSDNPKKVKGLAAVLLFSISYGCAIGGIGTPSGGARNAIMIGYWKDFFFDPTDPATRAFLVDYVRWIKFAYPIFLAQLPLVTVILFAAFKPERKTLSRAVVKLRKQIEDQGPMKANDWLAVGIFFGTLVAWITLSEHIGLGTVALFGAILFLAVGLVPWNDMNSGVNWGVVLLYAATISLGVQMKDSGAAEWIATSFLALLKPLNMDHGLPLLAAYTGLTTVVTNTMSAGAAVAVLGPIALRTAELTGESPLALGFITAISSSFAYFTAAAHPAFTIVYASGYLKAADFFRVGWRMALMSAFVLLAAAKFYWPLLGA
ncbi:Sodium-dependent anion transporter family [hydrothermal vent metagenome]|uniref:Sodium-dependent anion transporter family n=1 Tax=hydrothermal vent metagenome TaxID=652676 RepID=A0A3B0RCV7_9ZZZZ